MFQHPYMLEAMYQARRQDELGTIEIDGLRYRAADLRSSWSLPIPRLSLHLDLGALVRRYAPVARPAQMAS
jgi:hypothetical protein